MKRLQNHTYLTERVECLTCGELYQPSKDIEIKLKLNVPPISANSFCSRKCLDDYSKLIEFRKILKSEHWFQFQEIEPNLGEKVEIYYSNGFTEKVKYEPIKVKVKTKVNRIFWRRIQ